MNKFLLLIFISAGLPVLAQVELDEADQGGTHNYVASTCKWVEDIPRRKPAAPKRFTCGGTGNDSVELCMGYVVCDTKSDENGQTAKFVRMATCGSETCGDKDAYACVKAAGYGSRKPSDKDREGVSNRVKSKIQSAIAQ